MKNSSIKLSKRRKQQVQQSMWPYGLNQTHTHSTSYDSSEHALDQLVEACLLSLTALA